MVVTGSKHASTIHIDSVPVYTLWACTHAWIGQRLLNQTHVRGLSRTQVVLIGLFALEAELLMGLT